MMFITVRLMLIFLMICSPIWGKINIDSLQKALSDNPDYSKKVLILNDLIDYLNNSNPNSALQYIAELEKLADSKNDKENLIQALLFKSIAFAQLGELEKSNSIAFDAIKLSNENKIKSFLPRIYLAIGINYLRLSEHEKALSTLLKAKKISKENNNFEILANVNITLGLFKKNNNEPKESIKYFTEAESYFKSKNNLNSLSIIYTNLSGVYLDLQDTVKALQYTDLSIDYNIKNNDERSLAVAYNNKGAILATLKDFENALDYTNKSIAIKEKQENKIGLANSYIILGNIYTEMKQYQLAINYLLEANKIFINAKLQQLEMSTYTDLEKTCLKMGDYKSAYKYSKLAQAINDTLFNSGKQKIIEELNAKYEVAEKEKENQLLIREADKQNFFIILAMVALGFMLIIAIMFYLRIIHSKKTNKLLSENQKVIESKNTELNKLINELNETNKNLEELNAVKDKFFSIIAHDLKSPISTLNQLIITINNDYTDLEESERIELLKIIEDSSTNTYNLLQNLLTWSRAQLNKIVFTPEDAEVWKIINQISKYLNQTALEKDITIINKVKSDLLAKLDVNLFSTIIRNLISNAIKYTNPGGEIKISLEKEDDDELVFSVSDTGIGMKQQQIDNLFRIDKTTSTPGTNREMGTGLGLILCKEFVSKHGGNIWVESEAGKGSKFYLTILKNL